MSSNEVATGLSIEPGEDEKEPCRVCVEANLRQANVPRTRTRSLAPMDVLGCDLQEVEQRSRGGHKYLALYCDHSSGCVATRPLKQKSDQAKIGLQVVEHLEVLTGKRLKILRADQGGEFTAQEFVNPLIAKGIKIEYSDTDQPFQNGLAEVTGRKIFSMMRAARVRSGVPKEYWVENAAHQTWVHNRVASKRQNGATTPIQELTGEKADLSRARVFGCEAWVLIRRHKKQKLDARAQRAVHLGISQCKKAWVFLLWDSRKIIESRNAHFYEDVFPFKSQDRRVQDEGDGDADEEVGDEDGQGDEDANDQVNEDGDVKTEDGPGEDRGVLPRPDDDGSGDQGGAGGRSSGQDQERPTDQGEEGSKAKRSSTRVSFKPDRYDQVDWDEMARRARGSMTESNSEKISFMKSQPMRR
jgi:hypothetical protein